MHDPTSRTALFTVALVTREKRATFGKASRSIHSLCFVVCETNDTQRFSALPAAMLEPWRQAEKRPLNYTSRDNVLASNMEDWPSSIISRLATEGRQIY